MSPEINSQSVSQPLTRIALSEGESLLWRERISHLGCAGPKARRLLPSSFTEEWGSQWSDLGPIKRTQNARELLCCWKIQLCWFRIPLSNQINAESALFMSLAFTWSEKSHIFLFWPFLTKDILLLNEKLFSESFRSCTSSWFLTIWECQNSVFFST